MFRKNAQRQKKAEKRYFPQSFRKTRKHDSKIVAVRSSGQVTWKVEELLVDQVLSKKELTKNHDYNQLFSDEKLRLMIWYFRYWCSHSSTTKQIET